MRLTQRKANKTKLNVNSGSIASNTRSKTNKNSTCVVNIIESKKNNRKLQKKKIVRKSKEDTTQSVANGAQNEEQTDNTLVLPYDCESKIDSASRLEVPKKSEDGFETTPPEAISPESFYKTEEVLAKEVDIVSNKKTNVKKKQSRVIVNDNSYKKNKVKRLLKKRNRIKTLSNRKLLKNTKNPPNELSNTHKNTESNGTVEEVKDAVANKLSNIIIQRNFSKSGNGCDKRDICKVWLTELPHKLISSTSEKFLNNDVIVNEMKPPPKIEFESKSSSDSDVKEEKITNILNGLIDYTNLSDVESTTTFSNLSANSNCALCVDVPKEKKVIQRTDHNSDTNPFVKYRLESCDLNIKITQNFKRELIPSMPSHVCKKPWTCNHFFKLQTYIIRITSKDSIFRDAILGKDDAINENTIIQKCVLNTENLIDGNSQKCSSPFPHNFLLPLLPPSKRPPTRRPVTSVKNTKDYDVVKTSPPEDDAISLYACSIVSSPEMDFDDRDYNIKEKKTVRSDNSTVNSTDNSTVNSTDNRHNSNKEVINLKSVSTPEKHGTEESTVKRPHLTLETYQYIPNIFRGVCYFHFYKKNCRRKPYCTKLHGLYPNTEETILNLPYKELHNVYNYTKGKMIYKETFPFFVNAYVKHNKVLDLVNIVRDVVNQDMFERSPFVEKIIEAIQSIGYSFHQAIEEMITILGITNLNMCLSDILVNIVVRSSENLEVDWPLIKKLTKYRTDKLDHGVVEDIVRICVKFKSPQLCLNFFRDILNTEIVTLEYLNVELLKQFAINLRQLEFVRESKILANKANISIIDDDLNNDVNVIGNNDMNAVFTNDMNFVINNDKNAVFNSDMNTASNNDMNAVFNNDKLAAFNNDKNAVVNNGMNDVFNNDMNAIINNDMNDIFNNDMANVSQRYLKENDHYQLNEIASFHSFSESEHAYENSYEFDELSEYNSYSKAGTGTPNCCDTAIPNNSAVSEVTSSSKNISSKTMHSLSNVIKNKDVSKFLGILEQYKPAVYVESFVSNVIKLLEKEDLREVYKMMQKIYNTISLEKYQLRFWFESEARNLIETLSFNVLALFVRANSWKQAANIIKKFSNDYVNFAKAKCTKIHKYDYSELGKYLYFCKIFTRAGYLQDAYELLMDPELRLLNEKTTWTITRHQSFDSAFRDDVVKKFLSKSISTDVNLAKRLILHIIRDESCIINIDVWQYYNDLLVALMNCGQYYDILDMLDDIVDGWNLKLKKEVFRGLLIILLQLPNVDPLKIMTLYVCACKRGFYKLHTGAEKEIVLKTDMLYEEIYLILHMFFFKQISCESFILDDLCLKLQLPEVVDERPSLLLNSNVSINDFRTKIYRVLAVAFYHPICVAETGDLFSITINKRQLETLLHFYKNQNNFFI